MPQISIKDYLFESRIFFTRAVIAAIIVFVALSIIIARMVNLQITSHEHYRTLSQDNRVKTEPLPPTRGLIHDSHGNLLAQNLPAFSLEVTPEKVKDLEATLSEIAKIIPISDHDRQRFMRLKKQRRRFDSIPIRVRLNEKEVALFAINQHHFPGVDIKAILLRDYPQGEAAAHVIGYVGRINQRETERIDLSEYSGTRHIGKNGIEKSYEVQLHGKVGVQQVEVNAKGRVLRVLESQPPTPGYNLRLFLDMDLQREALAGLEGYNGAVVAIDPKTGGILVLASKPGFDANLFVDGISSKQYNKLRDSLEKPLFNRALRGQYPPGSTIKPFIGLAGLERNVVKFAQEIPCFGFYQLPGQEHKYRDWKKRGHGQVSMKKAMIESCDVYYYSLARALGIDRIEPFLGLFGFGTPTGIDITGELGGLLPSRAWKREHRNEPWYPGETLILGIGQGYLLTTPLQLASATATLAMRGKRITPRMVKSIESPNDQHGYISTEPVVSQLPIEQEQHWDDMTEAMIQVIEGLHGTARRIRSKRYRIAGKTGTAQVFTVAQEEEYDEDTIDKRMRDHALFIAYAPVDDPQIAIAVIVENGGHGGSVAAPIAKRVMDRYLLGAGK
ncbi:MAG: penicillin-binding protein 2 [Candidatus Polarisedimenticolaceae bacterium]|nr:penicillin-binding protein 2 [Candidatus Polarisedimenticolaceae bacterium]